MPGQYIGIEHQVNQSAYTGQQRRFDDLVTSGSPAIGQLNGEPIEVVDVDVIRVQVPPPTPDVVTGAMPSEGLNGKVVEAVPKGVNDWGTYVPPEELRNTDGELGILQDFRDAFTPPDPHDPRNTA